MKQLMNKKGNFGMAEFSGFAIVMLIAIVVSLSIFMVLPSLETAAGATKGLQTNVTNETITIIDLANSTCCDTSASIFDNVVLKFVTVTNASNGTQLILNASNYTITKATFTSTLTSEFNNTQVNVTFTADHTEASQAALIGNNVTTGIGVFWSNASTWYSIFAIVVLILIIGVIVTIATRFQEGVSSL